MSEESPKKPLKLGEWLTTIPGIITAIATLITAIGGLIVILNANKKHEPNKMEGTNTASNNNNSTNTANPVILVNSAVANPAWIFNLDSIKQDDILEKQSVTKATDRKQRPNQAYDFEGQSSYMKISGGQILELKDSFSVVVIIKNHGSPAHSGIISHYDNSSNKGWQLVLDQNNNMRIDIGFGRPSTTGQAGYAAFIDNTDLQKKGWTLIAFTYYKISDGNARVRTYIDGSLKRTQVTETLMVRSGLENVILGWDTDRPDRHFNGIIDDIIIYKKELTQDEITSLFTSYF